MTRAGVCVWLWVAVWGISRGSYDVDAEGAEGVGSTHVQMSGIKPLEEADVIETLGLKGETHRTGM